MDMLMTWVAILTPIIMGFIGYIFNNLITNKINDIREENKKLRDELENQKAEFYDQLNGLRKSIEATYVRKDLYEQALQFHQKETDNKFENLISSITKQFDNVEKNIDSIRDLINSKVNGKKKEGEI